MSIETTRIPLTDLYRLSLSLDGSLSPDGAQAMYELMYFTEESREKRSALWLAATDGSHSEALTDGASLDTTPRWSPDGTQIAFLRKVDDKAQMHLLDVATREIRQITSLPLGVGGAPAWSPDSTSLAFTANPTTSLPPTDQPYHLDRAIIRFDDVGYVHRSVQEVFVVDAAGGNLRQVTFDNALAANPQWSPAGDRLLYLSTLAPTSLRISPTLKVVTLDGEATTVIEAWGSVTTAVWMPDGRRVVYAGAPTGLPIGTQEQLWLVDAMPDAVERAEPTKVSVGFNFKVGGGLQADMQVRTTLRSPRLRVSEDGEWVYAQAQVGGTVQILRFALDGGGAREIVATGDRTCSLLDVRGDSVLSLASTLHDPVQVVVTSAGDRLAGERVLTALNREILAGWDRPEIEHMLYASVDGEQVEGWLMLPEEGQAPWPTVVYVHGGPHSAFGHIFSFDFRLLAAAGYAVLFVNQRASTGYGDHFATQIKGDWGNLDFQDIMYGVDEGIARGLIDGDRLGICGLSGGGNLTCWAIGHTDRFKAAVPENPVTNWFSFYGVSDIGPWFATEELGGHPWEIPEVYTRCSPITYAHLCRTPTMFVQGEADYRCPAEQSEQFYTILKVVGCPVEMVRIPNSPHGGAIAGNAAQSLAQNEALLGWMQKWV